MSSDMPNVAPPPSPWLTVREAAQYARCGVKTIYRAVSANQLQCARIGLRRDLRFRVEYLDKWLEGTSTVVPR